MDAGRDCQFYLQVVVLTIQGRILIPTKRNEYDSQKSELTIDWTVELGDTMKRIAERPDSGVFWANAKESPSAPPIPGHRPLRILHLKLAEACRSEARGSYPPLESMGPLSEPTMSAPTENSCGGLAPLAVQNTLNRLLNLSLENIPLEEFLQRALDTCLDLPGLSAEAKGAIFLVDDEEEVLLMQAQTGSYPAHCARVPFGHCLCGRAAMSQAGLYAAHSDGRYDVPQESALNRGHYCLPIRFADRTLGVLNCYLQTGHTFDPEELAYLTSVSDILANVIERKRSDDARMELIRQNHLLRMNATLGVFAAMIGHDIKNYLFFEKKLSEVLDDPLRQHPGIVKGIERARRMAQGMKDLTMPSDTAPQTFRVAEMAQSQVEEFETLFGEHCHFLIHCAGEIPLITSVEPLLSRVIFNLLMNAFHAAENRPESLREPPYVRLCLEASGDGVSISVEDNAGGIGQRTLGYMERLFGMVHDAYHDQGNLFDVVSAISSMEGFAGGVGLFFTAVAVQDMSGTISVKCVPGHGSTFIIWLPERIAALRKLLRF